MPLGSSNQLSPTPRVAAATGVERNGSLSSLNKENVSPTGNSEVPENGARKLEKARALAHSATRGRLNNLIIGKKYKERKAQKPRAVRLPSRQDGQLSFVMNLPIDIFCEVARHLSPYEILQLARTSTTLRDLLISKQSRSIWRATRDAQGLPGCPDEMSEPEFASLLYDRECQACGARVKNAEILLRLRLCKACFRVNVIKCTTLVQEKLRHGDYHSELVYLLPYFNLTQDVPPDAVHNLSLQRIRFFINDFVLLTNAYHSFNNTGERSAFVLERLKIVQTTVEWATEVNACITDVEDSQAAQNELLKLERAQLITKRLLDLGHEKTDVVEASTKHADEWRKLVRQPIVLTDRNWNTIRPKLEAILQPIKKQRAQNMRTVERSKEVYKCYYFYLTGKLPECAYYYDPKSMILKGEATNPNELELLKWNTLKSDIDIKDLFAVPTIITFTEFLRLPAAAELIKEDIVSITHNSWRHLFLTAETTLTTKRRVVLGRFAKASLAAHFSLLYDHDFAGLPLSPLLLDTIKRALSRGPFIMNGPAALYFAHGLSSPCASYRSIIPSWPKLMADAKPNIQYLQESDFYKFEVEQIIITIAYSLLVSLGCHRPEEIELSELELMGKAFVCVKCWVVAQKRMSWADMVYHYFKEGRTTSKGRQLVRDGKLTCTFVDDHDLSGALVSVAQPASFNYFATDTTGRAGTSYNLHCDLCDGAEVRRRFMSHGEAIAHAQAKHDKSFDQEDFCVH